MLDHDEDLGELLLERRDIIDRRAWHLEEGRGGGWRGHTVVGKVVGKVLLMLLYTLPVTHLVDAPRSMKV